MSQEVASVIGLDIGTVRIGVSKAAWPGGIAFPLTVLSNDESLLLQLKGIIEQEKVELIVAGIPRGLNGQETQQTKFAEELASRISRDTGLPLKLQDEAGTSIKAEAELKSRNKPYDKADIDALSATYILEDFLLEHSGGKDIEA